MQLYKKPIKTSHGRSIGLYEDVRLQPEREVMKEELICPACGGPVKIVSNEYGYYTGCANPECKIFIETGIYKTELAVRKVWPWIKK